MPRNSQIHHQNIDNVLQYDVSSQRTDGFVRVMYFTFTGCYAARCRPTVSKAKTEYGKGYHDIRSPTCVNNALMCY